MTQKDQLHPIVEQMAPSPEQLKPILSRGQDVVVTAGAGTGKTRTLVARYLSLLADGLPLRSIIAITFTRKAAREMRNRIREEVRRYLQAPTPDLQDRERWVEIYDGMDAARISTIHTLCAEIIRHHPAESGVDPAFEMIEEGKMALLQARAAEEALGWAVDDPQTVGLFTEFGAWELQRLLRQLMEKRLDVQQTINQLPADIWSHWQDHLLQPLQSFLEDPVVTGHMSSLSGLREDGRLQRALEAGDNLAPDLQRALEIWERIQHAKSEGDWSLISRLLYPLKDSLKQKGRQEHWAPAEPKEVIAELQSIYDQRLEPLVRKGMDLALDRRLANEIVPALVRLFQRSERIYTEHKNREGVLDFDDLEWKARRLLEGEDRVQEYWQGQARALLVDEFQDTNGRQRDILELLNGGRDRLFIVGDSKQSIYRFRGADVSVFQDEEEQLRRHGEGYHLATSYRAHKRLVDHLNAMLKPVLGPAEPDKPFVAPFEPITHLRERPSFGVQQPFVEFHLTVGSKREGALERAAEAVVARLQELVEGPAETGDPDRTGGSTDMDYGDVAILCRASRAFPAYENALEEVGIPFLTISGRGFYDRPEVRDLLNILRALADPYDDLAMAGLLRSPVGGLSDMALYRLRRWQRDQGSSSLYEVLSSDDLSFLDGEEPQAGRARSLFDDLQPMVGRVPVARLLKEVIDRSHYRGILYRDGQNRGVNNISKLLSDAHQSGMVSISQFLAYIDELREVSVREGEAQAVPSGGVQVMTVHQAKGLEFPVVVIGDLSREAPRVNDVILDDQLGILPPLTADREVEIPGMGVVELRVRPAAYRLAKGREEEMEEAEANRLLYVAATRAQEKLLLSGTIHGIKKDGTPYTMGGWLGKLGKPLGLPDIEIEYDPQGETVHQFTLGGDPSPLLCAIYEPEVDFECMPQRTSQPSTVTWPEEMPYIQPLKEVPASGIREDIDRERQVWRVVPGRRWRSAPHWLIGKIVHAALAQWKFPDQEGSNFERWVRMEARSSGLTDDTIIEHATQQTLELLKAFQSSDLYLEMNHAQRRLHEIPFSLEIAEGQVKQGQIDAIYKGLENWVLVEFKTDEIRDEAALDALLQQGNYVRQVEGYLRACQDLLGQRPQPILCFLNVESRVKLVKDRW